MKTPRIHDFDPKAERPLGTPLEGMPVIEKPRASAPLPSPIKDQKNGGVGAVTEQVPPRITLNSQQPKADKFEKYSTYLRPGYPKKIKLLAVENDCDSYEIIDVALTQYFDDLKK
jgi:hypothetical protein